MHTGAYAHRIDGLSQSTGMRRYGLGSSSNQIIGTTPNIPRTDTSNCPPCTCKKSDYGLLILGICVAVPLLGIAILS